MSEAAHHGWMSPDQRRLEADALALLATPTALEAARAVAATWHAHVAPDAHEAAIFEHEFAQCCMAAALQCLNRDPARPRIHAIGTFAHALDGQTVPGTNYGHGNPDCIYRLIPVEADARYRLTGRFGAARPASTTISLIDDAQGFLGNIASAALAVDADGGFTVELAPGAQGPNTLANVAGAYNLCIRDLIGDVARERPAELAVERIGGAPSPARTRDDIVAVYPALLRRLVQEVIDFEVKALRPRPVNSFGEPSLLAAGPFIPSQAFAMGRFEIDRDHALVFHADPADGYAVLPATNVWGGLGAFPDRPASWNASSASLDADGTFRAVLALDDPGVPNWIDPGGATRGMIVARWTAFRSPDPKPRLTVERVLLAGLRRALPPDTPVIDRAVRARQLAGYADGLRAAKSGG